MTLYGIVVFLHVASAMLLVGGSLFEPLVGRAIRRAESVSSLRDLARYLHAAGQLAGRGAPLVLLTGIYLAFAGGWWGSGWLEVSLALFATAGILALGFLDPAAKRLVAAAEAALDGPVPADLDALRRSPRVATLESYLLAVDLGIVFLMLNKPGFTGALIVVALAAAVGTVLAQLERRHAVQPAAVEAA